MGEGHEVISVHRLRGAREPWHWVAWEDEQVDLGFEFGEDPIPSDFQLPRLVLLSQEGRLEEIADIPSHQVPGVLCVSGKAFSALAPFLTKEDQVVPLRTRLGEFYAINVRRFIDCLDTDGCEANWVEEGQSAFAIHTFAFRPRTVPHRAVFRIREQPSYVLVTGAVAEAIAAAGMHGYSLEKLGMVTPSPP